MKTCRICGSTSDQVSWQLANGRPVGRVCRACQKKDLPPPPIKNPIKTCKYCEATSDQARWKTEYGKIVGNICYQCKLDTQNANNRHTHAPNPIRVHSEVNANIIKHLQLQVEKLTKETVALRQQIKTYEADLARYLGPSPFIKT